MNDHAVAKGVELRLDTAIAGLQRAAGALGITSVVIGTKSYSVADAIKLAQERVAPWKARRVAKATLRQLALDRPRDYKDALELLADLRGSLNVALGRTNEALTEFGFKPERKPRNLTPEEKVLRTAAVKATRDARKTMGARQKAAIHGEPAKQVVVTPDGAKPATNPGDGSVAH